MPCSRSGNARFPSTLIESKSAALWNSIPIFRRTAVSLRSGRPMMSSPSTSTSPESGFIRPMRCFSTTLLPQPERPSTTSVFPSSTVRSTSCSTGRPSKLFESLRTSIIGPRER